MWSVESRESENFYPRPPRGGRLGNGTKTHIFVGISIHALREEGDCEVSSMNHAVLHFYPRPPRGGRRFEVSFDFLLQFVFLSTPSARRATYRKNSTESAHSISIHALREEGDLDPDGKTTDISHFYPRPPRGGRHVHSSFQIFVVIFLSTPSARRATGQKPPYSHSFKFLSTPSARRAT